MQHVQYCPGLFSPLVLFNHVLLVLDDLLHDCWLCQGADIAKIMELRGSDLTEDTTHDLTRSGLGQALAELKQRLFQKLEMLDIGRGSGTKVGAKPKILI